MRPGWMRLRRAWPSAREACPRSSRSWRATSATIAKRSSADPDRLQAIRERLSALKALQRKYGATEAEVLAFLEASASRLATLATADERLSELTEEVDRLQVELRERAASVTRGRTDAAPALAAALERELQQLGMPGASIERRAGAVARARERGGGARRASTVAVAGAEGRLPRQDGVGGELSRTMLACRSVMADLDDVPTLVFDEVDAGIGGEAGLAVGRRLANLAGDRQVLVVTHLPQIACFADRHILVEKGSGTATVRVLSDDERVHELSRMLAGLTGSDGAITHAEELLADGIGLEGRATG